MTRIATPAIAPLPDKEPSAPHTAMSTALARWRSGARRALRMAGIAIGTGLLLWACSLGVDHVSGNFHEVVDRQFYRSGQLTPTQISTYAEAYGIKTIINLRDDNQSNPWYEPEVQEARRLGIAHLDFAMSAERRLSMTRTEALIALMRDAEKPILIHCKAGADRSGLASALYLAAVAGQDPDAAARQLSIRYGHFSLPFVPEYAMDRTFKEARPLLARPPS